MSDGTHWPNVKDYGDLLAGPHRATCSCGWGGTIVRLKRTAFGQWNAHFIEATMDRTATHE